MAAVAPVACDPPTIDGQKIKAGPRMFVLASFARVFQRRLLRVGGRTCSGEGPELLPSAPSRELVRCRELEAFASAVQGAKGLGEERGSS